MALKYMIEQPIIRPQDRMNKPAVIAARKAAYCEESAAAQLGTRRSSTPQAEVAAVVAGRFRSTVVYAPKYG
jgi:hypothetical protein